MTWLVSVKDCGGVYCLIVERGDLIIPYVIRVYLYQCPRKRITRNILKKMVDDIGTVNRRISSPVDNCKVILGLGYELRECL